MSALIRLQDQLDDWGVEHFKAHELVGLPNEKWNGPRQVVPPEALWPNIRKTSLLASQIREAWGDSVACWSGYRPPPYNKVIGGSPRSQHKEFKAMDLHPLSGFFDDFLDVVEAAVGTARLCGWNVGLGIYPDSEFVHIDVGATTRHNGNWIG